MDRARWQETLVYALNRPLAYGILEAAGCMGPVVHIPRIGHIVSDADIAREILTDPQHFDSHSPGSLGVLISQVLGPFSLLNMDGPEHTRLKRSLQGIFSAKYVDSIIDATTSDYGVQLVQRLEAGQEVDAVTHVRDVASRLACLLIGVKVDPQRAEKTYADIFELATAFTALAGLGKQRLVGQDLRRGRAIVDQLAAHIRDSYNDQRQADRSVTQALRDQGYSFEEVKGVVIIVMVGAIELITYGMPRVLALLIDSGQMTLLQRQPELLDNAVDEGFRIATPSNVILRAVTGDCEIGGHRFKAGNRALVVFHNIMRNRRHFPNGGRFDIRRPADARLRYLPFGAGPHMCLGTGLATAEARQFLQTLLPLQGKLAITRRRYNHGKTYPGYASLLVRLNQQ